MKQSIITDETGKTRLNLNEGYKCLNQLETIQTIDNLRDSTYLEPAFDERLHYNEIENHEEINEPGISVDLMNKQNKESYSFAIDRKVVICICICPASQSLLMLKLIYAQILCKIVRFKFLRHHT